MSVNTKLADAAVSHSVDLHQHANHVVQRMIRLLNRVDIDLFTQLTNVLETLDPAAFTVQRLDSMLYSVRSLNAAAYAQIERELTAELRDFVEYEAGFQYKLFETTIPPQVVAQVGVAQVSAEQIYVAALARPFQGKLLSEALKGMEESRAAKIRDAIRIGYVENQTMQQIVQRLRGTRALKYADGLFQAPRRDVEAVTRTALSHFAGVARDRFFEANGDLIASLSWSSTIDLRTSEICRIRDGLRYTADAAHKPIGHAYPWLAGPGRAHWCCRSVSVPITKSWKELGGADIESFSPTTRASMDGQIAAETTYADWLKRQSAARQDQILGPTRGALLRSGGLELKDMYSSKGRYLSLDELRAQDAAAFAKAGV